VPLKNSFKKDKEVQTEVRRRKKRTRSGMRKRGRAETGLDTKKKRQQRVLAEIWRNKKERTHNWKCRA